MNEDIRYYFSALLGRLPLLIGVFAVIFLISIIAALKIPPVYRSSALILVESQQIPDELVRSTVTSLPDERIAIIERRIMTRDNLLRIVEKFDLYSEERQKLSISDIVGIVRNSASIERVPLGPGMRRGNASISFTVSFEHRNPSAAAQVTNEIVTLVLEENVRSRTLRAEETERFLQREVERIRSQLTGMEAEIAEFKRKNSGSLPDNLPFKIAAVERLRDSISELDQEARELSDERRLLELGLAEDGSQLAQAMQSPAEQRYEQLQAQLVAKSATYSDSHPEVKWLKRELESARQQLESQAAKVIDATESDPGDANPEIDTADIPTSLASFRLAVFNQRLESLRKDREKREARIKELEDDISRTAQVELGLQALTRTYESAKREQEGLLSKLADARIGKALEEDRQAERFEVIEQPTESSSPIRPDRRKIAALGFLFAGAASGGLFFGMETLNMRLRGSSHLTNIAGHRPLVAIPKIKTKRDRRRRRKTMLGAIILLVLAGGALFAAIHIWYMPLDLLLIKLQEKVRILLFKSGAG